MRYFFIFLLSLLTGYEASCQITGTAMVCTGSTTTLACASPAGGTWSSSNAAIASIDAGGVVSGHTVGTAIITYQLLPATYTRVVTVNPIPTVSVSSSSVCIASQVTATGTPAGGIWASGEAAVASVDISTGIVTGAGTGATDVIYTLSTGCTAGVTISVNPLPEIIAGPTATCEGTSVTLTNGSGPGTWSSSNPAVATAGAATGIVNAVTSGTAIISYQLAATGCMRTVNFSVNGIPTAFSGSSSICSGSFVSLSSAPAGGTWTSSMPAVVQVHSVTGVATGVAAGTANITYTASGTGCRRVRTQTVTPVPAAITGSVSVCPGTMATLTNSVAGGVWISSATTIATVSATPGTSTTVYGVAAGTAIITYMTGADCYVTTIATVNPMPAPGVISGPVTVCPSTSITLTTTGSGGTWSSSVPANASVSATGVVTGGTVGTSVISYVVSNMCGAAAAIHTVNTSVPPAAITGPASLCAGTTATLVNPVPGGVWSTSAPSVATIVIGSGLMTGISGGTATVTYSLAPACEATTVVTVSAAPSPISGADNVCVGSVITMTDTASGGVWSSSAPAIATIGVMGITTGVVSGLSAGTTIISYTLGSCSVMKFITVNAVPGLAATAIPDACGGGYTLIATGADTYSWAPGAGLSCIGCSSATLTPTATVTYTVTGTNTVGCNSSSTVTVNGDRIYGHIHFGYGVPATPDVKVWLVQFNPTDSSIVATDSTVTCMDGGMPYYEFSSKPSGSYLVKARLISSVAGTTDYMPTYGDSALYWYDAVALAHSGASDMQDVYLRYGSVPAGPGFIGGYVYSGAGKGTAGEIPEAGILVYLRDAATGKVLTYTYTDAAGHYMFNGIATGNYIIYPEEMDYYTTPSDVISLTAATISATSVSFKKHTGMHTIYPYAVTGVAATERAGNSITLYPNPANDIVTISCGNMQADAGITITDVAGRIIYSGTVAAAANAVLPVDVSAFMPGMYLVTIHAAETTTSLRLFVSRI